MGSSLDAKYLLGLMVFVIYVSPLKNKNKNEKEKKTTIYIDN